MAELKLFTMYLSKFLTSFKLLTTKPLSITLALPLVPIATVTNNDNILYILLCVFIADFITGVYASYILVRDKDRLKNTKSIIGFKNKILEKLRLVRKTVSSEKLRKSFIKAIVYLGVIYLSRSLEKEFALKSFAFETISDKEYTITTVVTAIAIFIESYSIFFENLPTAGFDIGRAFSRSIRGVKKIKNEVTE